MEPVASGLSRRAAAMLRAVADNRAEMTVSCEPDLRVDGLLCCDQTVSHELAQADLIHPARPGLCGQWVRAMPTEAGTVLLRELAPPTAA